MSNLHVYSAGCSWHGPISKVGKTEPMPETVITVGNGKKFTIGGAGSGLPCCPFCGSMLFQIDEKEWWDRAHEAKRPSYVAFLRWGMKQKRCWKNNDQASQAYNKSPESWRNKYDHAPFK